MGRQIGDGVLPAPTMREVAGLLGLAHRTVHSEAAHRLVSGRVVLVTGAGGSIGSELVRQLSRLDPAAVYLVDHDEGALHARELEMHGHGLLTDPHFILSDVRDHAAMTRIFAEVRPDSVFHAAAFKHLPLLERFPAEAIKTNIAGTRNVVAAATAAGAARVINISTDKAACPTSVLGATKRLAEGVAAGFACRRTRVASVRFGNVLGSRGSFLPSLGWQVAHGHPVTITDPDIERFFMTIPEAAGLAIEAAVFAQSGETYVLDMGKPIRILDLVRRYLDLAGLPEAEIDFTGLREGEKISEVLIDDSEFLVPTPHSRISRVELRQERPASFTDDVELLCVCAREDTPDELRAALSLLTRPAGREPERLP